MRTIVRTTKTNKSSKAAIPTSTKHQNTIDTYDKSKEQRKDTSKKQTKQIRKNLNSEHT